MPRAAACLLGLIILVGLVSCGGAPPRDTDPAVQLLLPEPGLAQERPAAPPFQLTSTDGVGLRIAAVRTATVIEDPLAVTELHLTFENPEDRTLEGRFTFTVPPGASLSRFAMKIQGSWMEGEVVEKQRARITYEEFLHQRKDPALLEQGAGNELAVRIFPIAPREKKELVVAYSEVLGRTKPYRLRLQGLSTIAMLEAKVFSDGKLVGEHVAHDAAPSGDIVLPASQWSSYEAAGLTGGGQSVVRVRIPDAAAEREPFGDTVVLVDTSASRALDMTQELAALKQVVGSVPKQAKLVVACFDQTVVPVFSGEAAAFGEAHFDKIRKRGALGASNLGEALAWARDAGRGVTSPRLVLLTDGVATTGLDAASDLASSARVLADGGFVRADAIALGGIREVGLLGAVVQGALPRAGVVVGVEDGAAEIERRLGSRTLPDLPVGVDGAEWVHPKVIVGAQPGDDVVVHVESKHKVASVRVGPHESEPVLRQTGAPLVARSVALARIASVEADAALSDDDKRSRIVALSTKHRVISDQTAMLVLETEADYDRFSIDRKANLSVLSIEAGRIALRSVPRGNPAWDNPVPSNAWGRAASDEPLSARGNTWGDALGALGNDASSARGGLGLSGIGEGGGGRGEGIGLGNVGTVGRGAGTGTGQGFGSGSGRTAGARASRPPQVRMGATRVSGRLPPEVVQRIVRQNFGRFRGCYEAELGRSANAIGRVSTQFRIGLDGSVANVAIASSEISSQHFQRCILDAFRGLTFPRPEGGVVTVTYPLLFVPAGAEIPPHMTAGLSTPQPSRVQDVGRSEPLPDATNDPYSGRFAVVMEKVAQRDVNGALERAITWRAEEPGEVLAYVALGEAAELAKNHELAARAYGSILELWSYRVDMLRLAGERLDRVGDTKSLELAAATYRAAVEDRPDHPSSHRLYAMALLKLGRPAEAFEAMAAALDRNYASGRFSGVETILRDDLAIIGAAWAAKDPSKRTIIEGRLQPHARSIETSPSLRFVLVWETDASDVDLHVADERGDHAYYGKPTLASGGRLAADVTNGYGPEAFSIADAKRAYPYKLRVQYYARGPMGFGMGKVQIVSHDGKGKLAFDERPFVLMRDKAVVDLGVVSPPGSALN